VTGDLVQQGVTQNDQSVTGALLAISTIEDVRWGILETNGRISFVKR
jgi:hypothetical protein